MIALILTYWRTGCTAVLAVDTLLIRWGDSRKQSKKAGSLFCMCFCSWRVLSFRLPVLAYISSFSSAVVFWPLALLLLSINAGARHLYVFGCFRHRVVGHQVSRIADVGDCKRSPFILRGPSEGNGRWSVTKISRWGLQTIALYTPWSRTGDWSLIVVSLRESNAHGCNRKRLAVVSFEIWAVWSGWDLYAVHIFL